MEQRNEFIDAGMTLTEEQKRRIDEKVELRRTEIAAADEAAAWGCKCAKASAVRRMREQITDARERVNRLFGNGAVDLGFKPIAGEGVIEVLERLVELIAHGSISTAAINVRGQCMAKFSVTSKGKIKVSRRDALLQSGSGGIDL